MSEERVQIVREDHPHYGETGFFTGKEVRFDDTGGRMAEVRLDSCDHGADVCYVNPGDITRVRENSDR